SKLRRIAERAGARAGFEVRALELERHGRAGKPARFQPRRYPLGQVPQMLLERAEFADVAFERCLRRNAFGFAVRIDRPFVEAASEPPQTLALDAIFAHQVG